MPWQAYNSQGNPIIIATQTSPRLTYTHNFPIQQAAINFIGTLTATGTTAASAAANPFGSSLSLQRIFLPQSMSLTEVDLAFGVGFPATNQGQGSFSQTLQVFSFGNSTSLASVLSASRAVTWATGTTTSGTSSSLQQGWSGPNVQPFTFAASALRSGEYAVAHLLSWAAASTSWFVSMYGANAASTITGSAVTNVTNGTLAAASSFATGSSALTAFTATPTSAGLLSSGGLVGVSAHTASTGAAITAFSGAPATLPVFLTATGTSVALLAGSVHTASGSAAITAFSAAPATLPVFLTATGTSVALLAGSVNTATASVAAFSAGGVLAGSVHTASTSSAMTAFNAAPSAFAFGKVGSTASGVTNTASLLSVTATAAASTVSFLMNTATGALPALLSGGLLAGSFMTASTAAGALSSGGFVAGSFLTASGIASAYTGGTGASSFMSTNGLLGGSFMTASGIASAYTGGTGASGFLSSGGLSAGSFVATSGSAAALANAGTAAAAMAASFTTNSFGALTALGTATATVTLGTTGLPSFGYNGSIAMTTATSQAVWKAGAFTAGIFATGSSAASIDLKSTAMLQTGSAALIQPWFALVGS